MRGEGIVSPILHRLNILPDIPRRILPVFFKELYYYYGLVGNSYAESIQSVITLDDLFAM